MTILARNRTTAMTKKALEAREYIINHPHTTTQEVMTAARIRSEASLYRLLLGFADDAEICHDGVYALTKEGCSLTVACLENYLEQSGEADNRPSLAERLLYLYKDLENAGLYGGISFEALYGHYRELLEQYSRELPQEASVKRSLQRDLARLESLGIIIERPSSGSQNRTYRLKQEYLPRLSPESAAVLYVSTLLYRNTLLNDAISAVQSAMESRFFKGTPQRTRVLKDRIYILGDTLLNPEQFGTILGRLIRAVSESFRVKVGYINNKGKTSSRILAPLGLVCKRGVWYVIAWQSKKPKIRTFRVDQIQYLTGRETERFSYPEDFSLKAHIGDSWGVYGNDPVQVVRLRFSPQTSPRVKKLCYHPSQQVVEEFPDGSVVVQFQVCGLIEMQSWIMQWGNQVEVLEPAILRKRVRDQALGIAAQYQ